MNAQRIQEQLLRWIVILLTMVGALVLVQKAGTGGMGLVVGSLVGIFFAALVFAMREHIWLLIPPMWYLIGSIPALALPFSVRDLGVMAVFGVFLTLKAFKKITRKVPWDSATVLGVLLVIYVATCWVRNPTGFAALESDRVGGKPYFNTFIAILACWMLRQCALPLKHPTLMVGAVVIARISEGVVSQIINWFPQLASLVLMYYNSPAFAWAAPLQDSGMPIGEVENERLGYLSAIGVPLVLYVVSAIRPLSLLSTFRLYYPALFGIGIITIFLSGFRSVVIWVVAITLLSSYIRRGIADVVKIGLMVLCFVGFLIVGQGTLFELPYSAQRALSFLPGRWDYQAISSARGSTEWRVEMWRELLTTNRYIENHIFGDGFGMSKRAYEIISYNNKYGSDRDIQENFMITGGVHSGPVSSIRCVGYVGLAILLFFMCVVAVKAYRLNLRAKNTKYQTLIYFFCIPAVLDPVFFVFIFGAVEDAIPSLLFTVGILQMLENTLNDKLNHAGNDNKKSGGSLDVSDIEFADLELSSQKRKLPAFSRH